MEANDKNWYVVHTYSGYENRARQCLLDRIKTEGMEALFGDILVPTEKVVEVRSGSKRTTARKFFPGYIIVQMHLNNETWHLVRGTQKITGFVGDATNPKPIRGDEGARLTQQMAEGTVRTKPKQTFEQGANVRIVEGPFLNFQGNVDEVYPDKQKLRVLVSIFGRATPVEVDFMQVELV
jgi:transcription termination/antitermination protein NusG